MNAQIELFFPRITIARSFCHRFPKQQNVSKSTPEMLQVRDERHGKHNEDRGGKMEKWQNESRDMLCYIKHEDEPHFT